VSRTAANAVWLTLTRLTADFLSFLLFIAISRHFGPTGTGAYAYSFAVAALVSVCGTLGLDTYGIREYARLGEAERRPLLARMLATQALAMGTAILGLTLYLLVTRPNPLTATLIVLLTVHLLGLAAARTLFVPAFAHQAMAAPAVAELICRGGAILAALLMMTVFRGSLTVSLIGFPLAGLALATVAATSAFRFAGQVELHISRPAIGQTIRAAWPFAVTDLVFQVYARADLVLLSLFAGEAVAGIYASGFKFVEVGTMPLTFLNVAAFPRLSRLCEADPREFSEFATKVLRSTLFVGGLVAWGLFFVMPWMVVPLFGARFAPTAPLMRPLAALAFLFAVEIVLVRVLLAGHLQVTRLRLFAVGTSLNIVLNLVLIPRFQITGALAAWIVTLAVIDLLYARALRSHLSSRRLLAAFGAYVAAGTCCLGAGLFVTRIGPTGWLAAAVALLAYLLAAVGLGLVRPTRREWFAWPAASRPGEERRVEP
jgi:O-antigen/teichoic acid export membrane protein